MEKKYVQYGCGLSAPNEWINFDVSPTLRIQRVPVVGSMLKNNLNVVFPKNVLYGDIIRGLPIAPDSCDGLYCSHTLEHLSLTDFKKALKNSFRILKKGGIFRCVVPDLEHAAREYITKLDKGDNLASLDFMNQTLLGMKERPRGIKALLNSVLGTPHHLWMWDRISLAGQLKDVGFTHIRACEFNDSEDDMFKLVESAHRFVNAASIECKK